MSERELIEGALNQVDRAQTDPALPDRHLFPGYEILCEIHRGGQGVVYQALQIATKRRVAVKVMHDGPFAGSTGRARFDREIQILGQLNHPSIVQIHDSGITETGHCYYVMDYISGRTLDAHVETRAPDLRERLALCHRICDAVNAAHRKGVIHRDLKPSNIRVTGAGEPVLVDFGLARIAIPDFTDDETPQPMTITGQFIGSLPWASPEQAEGSGDAIDVRTDVYSLGVIMYRLLTGKFPYKVIGNMREVMEHILRTEPERPSTVSQEIDDEVETIVLKALCKEPDRRYQTAGELARDLDRYLKGEPISAKSDSGWYVMRKTLRRYRIQAGVALAFVSLLALGALVSTLLLLRTKDAEKALVHQLDRTDEVLRQAQETRDAGLDLVSAVLDELQTFTKERPGTTLAQVVSREAALEYLDRVDADNDPDALPLLATTCEALGDILGGRESQVQGDTALAATLYTRSRTIRASRLEAMPDDPDRLADAAESDLRDAWIHEVHGRYEEAATSYTSALARFEDALRPERVADTHFAFGNMWVVAALNRNDTDLLDHAPPHYDACERFRDETDDEAGLAALLQRRSTWSLLKGRAINGSIDPDSPRAVERLDEALDWFHESVALATLGVERTQLLPDRDTVRQRRDLAYAWHALGEAQMWVARNERSAIGAGAEDDMARARRAGDADVASMDAFSAAHGIATALADADEANLLASRDLVRMINKLARAHEALGRHELAATLYRDSVRRREANLRQDDTPATRRELAVAQSRLAENALHRARTADNEDGRLSAVTEGLAATAEAERLFFDLGLERDLSRVRSVQIAFEALD